MEDAPAVFSLLEDKRPLFETDLMKEVLSKNSPVKLALLRACNQVSHADAGVAIWHFTAAAAESQCDSQLHVPVRACPVMLLCLHC